MKDLARASVEYLERYLDRIERALEVLPSADTWWAPHGSTLSVGNLLVHLNGNVRQWILSGIDRATDLRNRAAEFAVKEGPPASELIADLRETVESACRVVAGMSDDALNRRFEIQGNDVTGWEAIYHVVEHFSWHTGQIVWIAKTRAGADHGLAFYNDAEVNALRNRGPDD